MPNPVTLHIRTTAVSYRSCVPFLASSPASDLLPAWVSAIATVAGVVVACVAIALTLVQVRSTAKELRMTARRQADDSEERTRPYVSVDVVPSLAGPPAIDLVLVNSGRTVARDVRLEVVGAPFEERFAGDQITPAMGRAFASGLDVAPASRRRFYWHFPSEPTASPSDEMGAPAHGEILVRYQWQPEGAAEVQFYEDRYSYNLDDLLRLTPVPFSGPKADTGNNQYERNVEHALRAIAQNVGDANR